MARRYCKRAVRAGLLGCGLLAVLGTFARAGDLSETWRLADSSDPTWQAAIHEQRAAAEQRPQAWAPFLPQVSANAGYTYTRQNILSTDNRVFARGRSNYPSADYAVTLEQSIWNYSNWATLRKARATVAASEASLEAARQDMLLRAAERYFFTVAALETLISIQAEKRAVERLRDVNRTRQRDGTIRGTEVLDAEARYLQVAAREIEAAANLRDGLQGLREVTGREFDQLRPLSSVLGSRGPQTRDPAEWVKRALENNPRVAALRLGLAAATAEVTRQEAEYLPRLGAVLQQDRRRSDGSLFGGGSDVQNRWAMVRLTVPLYNGGMTYSRVREARELLAKTNNEELAEERAVERRARNSLNGVQTALSRVRALTASVQAKQRIVESWQVAYRGGAAASLAVLEAERDLFFTRAELVRARHQYVMDTLRLKHAVGGLATSDLENFNSLLDPTEVAVGPYVEVH